MIKNIIFDVGDVLVDFRYHEYMKDLGFDEDSIIFLRDNMIFTDFWEGMDLGVRDVDDACGYFSEKYPDYSDKITTFWNNIESIVSEYGYAAPLIRSLKDKGYKVYLLSNYPDKLADMHWKRFTFLEYIDGFIISAKVKLAKPDPAIYRLLMDRYRLKAEQCLFIDDREKNVNAAVEVGMRSILFNGYDELVGELEKIYDNENEEALSSSDPR
ncbi:MAG TPA: hypothetical protein DCP06_01570 [Lachnospiraceae bacterium]|nr:hypothetical protein [Lachnospiraceae bacterium]